jgi:hypothetical protein
MCSGHRWSSFACNWSAKSLELSGAGSFEIPACTARSLVLTDVHEPFCKPACVTFLPLTNEAASRRVVRTWSSCNCSFPSGERGKCP